MSLCRKCDKDVQLTRDGCKCSECQSMYHIACVGDAFKKRGSRTNWKCDECVSECSSTGSKSSVNADRDQGQTAVLEAIYALRREINERWDNNDKKLDQMCMDINGVKDEIKVLKTELKRVETVANDAGQSVERMLMDNKRLSEELSAVKSELLDLQQHSRKNNIIISGIPVWPSGSNVFEVIKKIAELLDVPFYRSEINAAHWLPFRQGNNSTYEYKTQPIVVSFVSRVVKNEWISARWRRKSLKACELDCKLPSHQIYINEQLVPQIRTIFNTARGLMKNGKLSSVWTSDGRVLVKKTATSRPYRVTSLHDLDQLASQTYAAAAAAAPTTPTPQHPAATTEPC